jgi:predicted Zn-dependent protease
MKEREMKRALCVACLALAWAWAFPTQARADGPRRRLHESAAEDRAGADVEAEVQLGREVAARILGRYPLFRDEALARYVALVGNALARQSGRTEIEYRFAVLDTRTVNAYAAPGGYIFITLGALADVHDEAELAGVLAHEISHVTRRHVVRELNVKGWETGATAGVARFLSGAGASAQEVMGQAVDGVLKILFEKGYKVEDEIEADRGGLLLLAEVGYDPTSLDRYLARAPSSGGTHPSQDVRRAELQGLASALGLSRVENPLFKERFENHVKAR